MSACGASLEGSAPLLRVDEVAESSFGLEPSAVAVASSAVASSAGAEARTDPGEEGVKEPSAAWRDIPPSTRASNHALRARAFTAMNNFLR
jgi:hypothetical protein